MNAIKPRSDLRQRDVRRRFDRAADRFHEADFVHRVTREGLLDRMRPMTAGATTVIDLGAATGAAITAVSPNAEGWWPAFTTLLRAAFTIAMVGGIVLHVVRWWQASRHARIRRQIEWAALGLFVARIAPVDSLGGGPQQAIEGRSGQSAIDRLARQGMLFEQCYQSAPMCSPTRHNIYTGQYPVKTGAYPNHTQTYRHCRRQPYT